MNSPEDDEDDEERAGQVAEAGDPAGVLNPYDYDGYCGWCGNGSWKWHMPVCAWADHHEELDARPNR